MTFDRFDQTRLFAADVCARSARHGDVEVESAAENVLAEVAVLARFGEGFLQHRRAVIKLAADVNVRHRIRCDRVAGDDHPFDEQVRIFFHQQPVFERARLRFVGVAEQIRRLRRVLRNEAPLGAGRKSCAAAAAELRILHQLRDLLGLHLQRFFGRLISAAIEIHVDRSGVRLVDVREKNLDLFHFFGVWRRALARRRRPEGRRYTSFGNSSFIFCTLIFS